MEESLERELQRATRTKRSLAVILVDLDHFKSFNDNFGHAAGDVVLKSAAETFQHHFRADDVICRQGGEEFAIILPESSAKDAAIRAEKLRIQFQDLRMRLQERTLDPVTISIGIAGYPEHASTAEELLRLADKSLYQSKAQGRNRVTIAQTEPVPLP
jgi:diguanylate cyclase (GGDEF)-like protein